MLVRGHAAPAGAVGSRVPLGPHPLEHRRFFFVCLGRRSACAAAFVSGAMRASISIDPPWIDCFTAS